MNKICFQIIGVAFLYMINLFTLSISVGNAQDISYYQARILECNEKRFNKFAIPVSSSQVLKSSVDFSSRPEARKFNTRIAEEFRNGPNFADHYTVAVWGEGSPVCYEFAIVDINTGKILHYSPIDSLKHQIYQRCAEPFFRRDSTLIIFDAGCEMDRNFWADRMSAMSWREWGKIPTFASFINQEFSREWFPYSQYGISSEDD